jgi:hypothetical protein
MISTPQIRIVDHKKSHDLDGQRRLAAARRAAHERAQLLRALQRTSHLRRHGLGVDLLVDLDGRHGLLEDGQCDLRAAAAALDLALAALVANHAHAVSRP